MDRVNEHSMEEFLDNRLLCSPYEGGEQDAYGIYEIDEIEIDGK